MKLLRKITKTKVGICFGLIAVIGLVAVVQISQRPPSAGSDSFAGIRSKLAAAYSNPGFLNTSLRHLVTAQRLHEKLAPVLTSKLQKGKEAPNMDGVEFTSSNSTFCTNSELERLHDVVVILVHSAPAHFRNRILIRETWASRSLLDRHNVTVLFILGSSVSKAVQRKVQNESAEHKDIVQYSYLDSYRNMTYKNLAALKYISLFCNHSSYKLILKTDDDMFLHINPLMLYLHHQIKCNPNLQNTIFCAEFVKREVVQRNRKSKWYIPWTDFGETRYPPYCYGGGYVLTRDLVHQILKVSKDVPYYWIDDVYVTGLTMQKLPNVKHEQIPQQNPIKGYSCLPKCMLKNRRWFIHTLQNVEMLKSYNRAAKEDKLVRKDLLPNAPCHVPVPVAAKKPPPKKG